MLKRSKALLVLLLISCFYASVSKAQIIECHTFEDAIPGLTLTASSGGTNNRSGLAYNPSAQLYYSANAGSASYPLDTYDKNGELLVSPGQAFDYRGLWWNTPASQLEGNGFSTSGIFLHTLLAETSYPSGSGAVIFTANQPASQSVGTLNYDDNEIIYYEDGFIHRYSRTDNSFLGQFAVTGLPVELDSVNSNSVVYTGCENKEIGLYNFADRQLLYVNKITGAYNGFTQLPETAVQRSSFGMAYTNNLFWLFDSGVWSSYEVMEEVFITALNDQLGNQISLYPNPVGNQLTVKLGDNFRPQLIEIISMQGKLIHLTRVELEEEIIIPTLDLPVGQYLVRISSKNEVVLGKISKLNSHGASF